jgi:hypothetical protein
MFEEPQPQIQPEPEIVSHGYTALAPGFVGLAVRFGRQGLGPGAALLLLSREAGGWECHPPPTRWGNPFAVCCCGAMYVLHELHGLWPLSACKADSRAAYLRIYVMREGER